MMVRCGRHSSRSCFTSCLPAVGGPIEPYSLTRSSKKTISQVPRIGCWPGQPLDARSRATPPSAAHQAAKGLNFTSIRRAPSYTVEIFRMGWYRGQGARRIWGPITAPGLRQPIPAPDPETGLVDCDWQSQVSTAVGSDGRSGVYLAKLKESVGHCQSYVIFVVTDNNDRADIVFELPVNTYQAYNFWGGRSAYAWGCGDAVLWGSTPGRRQASSPSTGRTPRARIRPPRSEWAQANSCAMFSR